METTVILAIVAETVAGMALGLIVGYMVIVKTMAVLR
jgi:hypothetical protein